MKFIKIFLLSILILLFSNDGFCNPAINYPGTLLGSNDFEDASNHGSGTNYSWKSTRFQAIASGTATHFVVMMYRKDNWVGDQSSKDVGYAIYADAGAGENPGSLLSKGYVENYDFDAAGTAAGVTNRFYLAFPLEKEIGITTGSYYHLTMLIEDVDDSAEADILYYGRDDSCSPCPNKWQGPSPGTGNTPDHPPDDGVADDWDFMYADTSASHTWGVIDARRSHNEILILTVVFPLLFSFKN